MILVRDGKREPGHMDMQKLDEFCAMLPEVKLFFFVFRRFLIQLKFVDNKTLWYSNESSFRHENNLSSSNSSVCS